jgi:hypothetical protein
MRSLEDRIRGNFPREGEIFPDEPTNRLVRLRIENPVKPDYKARVVAVIDHCEEGEEWKGKFSRFVMVAEVSEITPHCLGYFRSWRAPTADESNAKI